MSERHLRAVPIMPQVADMPGAYTVRRPGSDFAEAIVHRSGGDWFVMYAHDPAAEPIGTWRGSATLPGRLDDAEAGIAALALVDAAALGVPHWADFLARSYMAGEPLVALAELHHPYLELHHPYLADMPSRAFCAGDGDGRFSWGWCPTVRLLAASFGLEGFPGGG